MVDYWLIFTLLLPFVEVLLHTYIESLNQDEDRTINHHGVAMEIDENGEKKHASVAQVTNTVIIYSINHYNQSVIKVAPAEVEHSVFRRDLISKKEDEQFNALK